MEGVSLFNGRRMKKVTDPLDAAVRASLMSSCSCNNSGDDISCSEIESLDEFWSLNKDDIQSCSSSDSASSSSEEEEEEGKVAVDDNNKDRHLRELESLLSRYRYNHLLATWHNVAIKAPEKSEDNLLMRKEVVECIKAMGYDAGICRCKCNWKDRKNKMKEREYEYVDVVVGEKRYILDMSFAEQFTMARYTARYSCFVRLLPPVFVGSAKTLEQIVTVMNSEMRRSMRDMGMYVPPWRKRKHMHSMWFGPYIRVPSQSKVIETPYQHTQQQKWAPPALADRAVRQSATMSALSRALLTSY